MFIFDRKVIGLNETVILKITNKIILYKEGKEIMEKVKEILKKSLLLLMIVTFSANILGESVLTAYAASNPLDTIRQYIDNMGHDWNKLAELYVSEKVESYINFFNNEDCINGNIGILNVNNAEFVECVTVVYDDVKKYLNDVYGEKEFITYVVGIDYSVNEDSIFFSNGISYNVISVVLENDIWKIGENVQIAEPEKLLEKGYVFSDEYDNTVKMMKAREVGILVNGDGEVFDTIGDQVEIKNKSTSTNCIDTLNSYSTFSESKSDHATNSVFGIPNSTTCVRLGYYDYRSGSMVFKKYIDAEGDYVDYPCFIPYHYYCLATTAGECREVAFDGEARKAIAMAIKTFTWYHIINPRDPDRGVHLRKYLTYDNNGNEDVQSDQCYAPNTVSQNTQVTVDYNEVKDIWMEDSNKRIFEACHQLVPKAKYDSDGDGINDYGYSLYRSKDDPDTNREYLNQNGCRYLVDHRNYNVYNILRYYYSFSRVSSGGIKFFTSDGKVVK